MQYYGLTKSCARPHKHFQPTAVINYNSLVVYLVCWFEILDQKTDCDVI